MNATDARNVLYIIFDDLRPDLSPYGRTSMHTPNLQRLADTGTTFERAFCQQSVCSPSRMSFTTGRRPNSTRVYNFINNFRQASCNEHNYWQYTGVAMPGGFNQSGGWGSTVKGGYAQCCTSCTEADGCAGWTFTSDEHGGICTLLSSITGGGACEVDAAETARSCISGEPGAYERWTPLPAHFREHGYLVLGAGKYYHDGGGGLGGGDAAHPKGPGQPPLADRHFSWSDVAVQWPNQTAYNERWGSIPFSYPNGEYLVPDDESCQRSGGPSTDYCAPSYLAPDGMPPTPPLPGQTPLADFVTAHDVTVKLRYAARQRAATGQPFFLVAGIKRPHLNWRVPPAFAALYPPASVNLPAQRTLDASVWPAAFTVFPMDAAVGGAPAGDFVTSPNATGTDAQLRELRRHYYAATSWADHAAGVVLDELKALALEPSTLVVAHSDHGWHLGEYAMWEKRTNFELATRVPLLIRVPWLPASHGARSRALVELVDLFPTACELMGLPLPTADAVPLDGTSLRPLLEAPTTAHHPKQVALSVFPRCRHRGMPLYGSRGLPGGADNSCLTVERTDFTWMGYSMRTDRYRYTEWVEWNGTSGTPLWHALAAAELYDHLGDDGAWTNPDAFENVNLVHTAEASLVTALSAQLHEAFRTDAARG